MRILCFFIGLVLLGVPLKAQQYDIPPYAEDYQIVTRDGAWCWFSDPRAVYVDNKMFGGFVDKEGSIWAFCYDPSSQERNQVKLKDKFDYDDHANPSIMVLPDKRLVLFFSAHGGTKNSPIYYTISKKPADISAWDELSEIDPKMEGNLGVCYTNAAMLSAEHNRTYLFFRGRNFKPTMIYSDDLRSWSNPVTLVKNDSIYGESGRPYMKVTTNHKDKIFFAFTDAHPRDRATNSIYFMLYKDGKLQKANGEIIADGMQNAITPSQTDKVYDATKTFDKAWIWDIAFDKEENPVLVYARFSHARSIHSYWYARWNGKDWENHKITDAAQCFMRNDYNNKNYLETEENYSGGVYLDHENPSIVYTSRPINNVFEIEKWTFVGGKEKWQTEAVTSQSTRDNVRPYVVRDYKSGQPNLLWMYNYKYPGFKSYDCAIRVNQKAKGFSYALNKKDIAQVADAVYNWQMREYQKNRNVCDLHWVSGVLYTGLFDWADYSGNEAYMKFLQGIFSRYYWQVAERMYHADDHCVGQTFLDMYMKYKKENMLIPTKARIDWVIANPPAENIDITKGASDRWWWCDALYMAPPIYARLYAITGDKKYMKFAHKEYLATYEHLYDKDEHLFYRDANYFDDRNAEGKKVFWSRGNGWVLAGLAEMLKNLPADDKKYRPFYEQLYVEMCERIATLQGADGYWRSDLLSPDIYPMPETSGTGLFTYAMAYGINAGLLPKEKYLPVVTKGWEALVKAVDTEGKIGWVQMVAAKPGKTEKKSIRGYAVGMFLATATELCKMTEE